MTAAVDVYGSGLLDPLRPVLAHYPDGATRVLPVGDWVVDTLPGDAELVARCRGATLDIGSGPGRLTLAVARRGLPALGVDIAPTAIGIAGRRGALTLPRSVFDSLPGTGRWVTALLADGNVGIGGRPTWLLRRVAQLLHRSGQLLVELEPPGTPTRTVRVRIEHDGITSPWFPWAHVSVDDIDSLAAPARLTPDDLWEEEGRWFAALVPC